MKKIGLVLAGGGGRGAYQIGVWKALRKAGLERYIQDTFRLQDNPAQTVKREGEEQGKAISEKWGHKKVGDNLGMAVLVYNSARHFHLIEDGHNLVKNGKTIGFVPGKHIMEKTRNEYKDIVTEKFQKMTDDILKEGGLD